MPNKTSKASAKSDKTTSHRMWSHRLRQALIVVLICLGGLAFAGFILTHWAQRQVLTPDNWVALVEPLPKQPVVSDALGSYLAVKLFANVPIEQEVKDALPPRAAFLSKPLSDQLKSITTKVAQRAVASDAFQSIWASANRAALNRALAQARGQSTSVQKKANEKFKINLGDIRSQIADKLGGTAVAIPALQPTSKAPLDVSTDLKAKPNKLHQAIKLIDFLASVLPLIILACVIWALALAYNRRQTFVIILAVFVVVMLLELILVRVARGQLLDQVHNSQYLSAVGYIYDAVDGLLRKMLSNGLFAALIILVIWLLAGPANFARSFRSYLGADRIRNSVANDWWHNLRIFVRNYRYYIWGGLSLIALISLAATTTVSGRDLLNAITGTLALSGIVYMLAIPRKPFKGGHVK
ncbi:MAG TPA: hypothetical protein VLF79_00040 [Candidatus Saccharimonadales bacterium]|nr:hypothetical protein [Candidatus Saccharimonadales bacterium]